MLREWRVHQILLDRLVVRSGQNGCSSESIRPSYPAVHGLDLARRAQESSSERIFDF